MTTESTQRKSFTFYLSFEKAISKLSDSEQLTIYRAISKYSLFGEEPGQLDGFAQLVWDLIEPVLIKSRTQFLNGVKGGAPEGNTNNRYSKNTTESTTQSTTQIQAKYKQDRDRDKEEDKDESIKLVNQRFTRKNSFEFLPLRFYDSDYLSVKDLWNDTCTNFRSIARIDANNGKKGNRKERIRNRLNEIKELTKNGTKEEAFAILDELFQKFNASKFLKGDNKKGWKASFDWLFKNETNWVKVWEGNYDPEQL